ncbi:hypothetical protein GWK47_015560 [Chionoecetes opilio]|uniref:Uncharacterized protein n=1 Tax=Chionoecetes opilio TaxID=41210 RepID=A0A8J5CKL0_CHIOP|nr:hypothetical protein GWK47_015560 [Chionoecetes opilio]
MEEAHQALPAPRCRRTLVAIERALQHAGPPGGGRGDSHRTIVCPVGPTAAPHTRTTAADHAHPGVTSRASPHRCALKVSTGVPSHIGLMATEAADEVAREPPRHPAVTLTVYPASMGQVLARTRCRLCSGGNNTPDGADIETAAAWHKQATNKQRAVTPRPPPSTVPEPRKGHSTPTSAWLRDTGGAERRRLRVAV